MSAVPVDAPPVPAARDSIRWWSALGGVGVVCVIIAAPLVLVVWAVPVVWAAWVDAQNWRLPDRIVLPGAVVVVTVLVVSSSWNGWSSLTGPLIGALMLGVPFLVLHLATPSGCGFVIAQMLVDFREELHWPGEVEIGTVVLTVGRSSASLGQGLFSGERCVAAAQTVLVLMDEATRRSTPFPDATRRRLEAFSRG